MALADTQLQTAIWTRLDAQLTDEVYDYAPQDAAFPYVVVGEAILTPFDNKTKDGQEAVIDIDVWTKSRGRKDVKALMSEVYTALHHQESNLSLTGFDLILIRFESSQTFRETGAVAGGDRYYHGLIRFRCLIQDS